MMKFVIWSILGTLGIATAAILGPSDRLYLRPQALPSSGTTGQIMVDSASSNTPKVWNGSAWASMGGGGSGFGRSNLLSGDDIDMETGNGNWTTFDDGAVSVPDDMTDGSPNITISNNTSTELRGGASLQISLPASTDLQGQGVSVAVTSELADKGLVAEVSFDYLCDTDYSDDDLEVWIYDVTNDSNIQPVPYKLKATGGKPARFKGYFQMAIDSTSYRAGFFRSITDTLAAQADCDIDTVYIGPAAYNYGTPSSEFTSYALVVDASTPPTTGSVSHNIAAWRRIGDSMEIVYSFKQTTTGTAGTGVYLFPLPSGYTIDSSKHRIGTGAIGGVCGPAAAISSGEGIGTGTVKAYTTTQLILMIGNETTAENGVGSTHYDLADISTEFSFSCIVPISGWGSNVAMSTDTDTRIVAFNISDATPTGSLAAAYNVVTLNATPETDTHGAYDGSNLFTAPVSGYYNIAAQIGIVGTYSAGNAVVLGLDKNSSGTPKYQATTKSAGSEGTLYPKLAINGYYLESGDTLRLLTYVQGSGHSFGSSVLENYWSITRVSGPGGIAMSESVIAVYQMTSGSAVTRVASSNDLDYDDKIIDTHNAVTVDTGSPFYGNEDWAFTAPVSGSYRVSIMFEGNSTAGAANNVVVADLEIDGTATYRVCGVRYQATVSMSPACAGSVVVRLTAGQQLSVKATETTGASFMPMTTTSGRNVISIYKVGF